MESGFTSISQMVCASEDLMSVSLWSDNAEHTSAKHPDVGQY